MSGWMSGKLILRNSETKVCVSNFLLLFISFIYCFVNFKTCLNHINLQSAQLLVGNDVSVILYSFVRVYRYAGGATRMTRGISGLSMDSQKAP